MGKQAIIHIGTGKTGTSSIQASLMMHKEALKDVLYPVVLGNSHHFLSVIYQPIKRLSRGHAAKYSGNDEKKCHADKLRFEFFNQIKNCNKLILSSEFLSVFNCDEISQFKLDLEKHGFSDFLIVVYVRSPASYYLSLIQQKMKASHHLINPFSFRYKFKEIIENYIKVFGDRICVAKFDKEVLHNNCVVQDFLNRAETFFGVRFDTVTTENVNESISTEALFVLQKYRELFHGTENDIFTKSGSRFLKILMAESRRVTHNKLVLKEEVTRIINRNHNADVQWLRDRFDIDFDIGDNFCTDNSNRAEWKLLSDIVEPANSDQITELMLAMLNNCIK